MARNPQVAGQFYPASPQELGATLTQIMPEKEERQDVLGALSPHAGYVYCGKVAGEVFRSINIPNVVILLNPSHNYRTPACALWTDEPWRTPLGEIELHEQITSALAGLPVVTSDNTPHLPEHSGEVVVPFLQYRRSDLKLAVICVTISATFDELLQLGAGIVQVIENSGERETLVVCSSDMSHESGPWSLKRVKENDALAIEKMERLDARGLFEVARRTPITMCGVLPAVAMLESVRMRGGTRGELLARATSADLSYTEGGYVVGYAGMIFH